MIFSLTLILFLLGLVAMWLYQAREVTTRLQEELEVLVELEDDRASDDAQELTLHLRAAPYLRPGSEPTFVAKSEALRDMDEVMQADLGALGLQNPLLDMVAFSVSLEYLDGEQLRRIADELQQRPGVAGVYYPDNVVDRIAANIERFGTILLAVAALFIVVGIVLIHNTVRLSLYANRFIIKTQELVGASWGFISRPFLWRAVWQGLISGILAAGGLWGMLNLMAAYLPELAVDPYHERWLVGAAGLTLLGIAISFVSYYVVVRRYLRSRVDELY